MLALLPLLLSVAPDLIRWVAGDTAGDVAKKAVQVGTAVLGTSDPAEAAAAIQDPAKALELRLALAKVAADAEAAKRQAELDALKAELSDVANARARDIAIQAPGKRNIRADVMIALVLVGLGGCLMMLWLGGFTAGGSVEGFILTAGGVFLGCFKDAFQFEFGSSRGSADKTAANERLTSALVERQATSTPAAIATTAPVTVNSPATTDDLNDASLRAARAG